MTKPDADNRDLIHLCGKLRDEDISQVEFSELESRLLKDPVAITTYRRFMGICSALEQSSTMQATTDELEPLSTDCGPAKQRPSRRVRKKVPKAKRHREISITVAAVCTIAAVLASAFLRTGDESTEGTFAHVSSVHQPVWAGDNSLRPDAAVTRNQYSLVSGAVQLKYANGAELLIQAPAQFTFEDASRVTLSSGVASLYIPPAATGFQVDTPYGSVVDHGTRIGVTANSEEGLELHVFEGKAELVPPNADSGTMLAAGEAAKLAIDELATQTTEVRRDLFANSIDGIADLPIASGDVELRISPPASVRRVHADLVSRGRATVFAERKSVALESDIKVTTTSVGVAPKVDSARELLAAGTVVDSYFVHLVLTRVDWRSDQIQVASGTLEFSTRILAVISENPAKTRTELGNPATDYPGDRGTGLESSIEDDPTRADQLEISPDGRKLIFRLQVHGKERPEQQDRTDQLRILVAAPSPDAQ